MRKVLLLQIAAAAAASVVIGCAGDGAKIVEGSDLSVGISLPGTDEEMSFTVLNWLSGFRISLDDSSRIRLRYKVAETNDYFGMIHTRTAKDIDAEIVPVQTSGDGEGGDAGD